MKTGNILSALKALRTWPLWSLARKHRVEVGLVVAMLLVGLVHVCIAGLSYTTSAKLCLWPERTQDLIGSTEKIDSSVLQTQCELISSAAILKPVLDKPEVSRLPMLLATDNKLAFLKKSLRVRGGKQDRTLEVGLSSHCPDQASQLVNQIVDSYIAYRSEHQRSAASEILQILQKEKAVRDCELTEAQQEMVLFKKNADALSMESDVVPHRLSRLSESITQAQIDLAEASSAYKAALAAAAGGFSIRPKRPEADASLRQQLGQMQLQLASIARFCTDDHPTTQSLRAKIEQAKAILWEQEQADNAATLAALKQASESAARKESELKFALADQEKLGQKCSVLKAQHAVIQSRIDRAVALSNTLDSRIKEIRLGEEAAAMNISLIEPASPNVQAETRPIFNVMGFYAIAGLLLAWGWYRLGDTINVRLNDGGKIVRVLGLPVLGAVGVQAKSESQQASKIDSGTASDIHGLSFCLLNKTRLSKISTLMVTSAGDGEGKSTIASGLALSWSRAGLKTLLIDSATERPVQHDVFELAVGQGLSGVLAGKVFAEQAIQKTGLRNLDVLTAGPAGTAPADALTSGEFQTMLNRLKDRYDRILIDAGPASDVANRIAASTCDGTVLVLNEATSIVPDSLRAVSGLRAVGATVIGVAVNAAGNVADYEGLWQEPSTLPADVEHAESVTHSSVVQD